MYPVEEVRVSDWDLATWKEAKSATAGTAYLTPYFLLLRAGVHIARRRGEFTLHSINIDSAPLMRGHRDEQNMIFILR